MYKGFPAGYLLFWSGPGIITGASDDDPSGIATYSQAGAKFGLGMLWLALFQYPIMLVIEEMCARIGLVTGSDKYDKYWSRHRCYECIYQDYLSSHTNNCSHYFIYSLYPHCRNFVTLCQICKDTQIPYAFFVCICTNSNNCRWKLA